MFQRVQTRLGIKFSVVLSVILAFSMISLTVVSTRLFIEFGELSASQNEANILNQAHLFLSRITREQAQRYGAVFERAATLASLIAKQAAFHLEHVDYYGRRPPYPYEELTLVAFTQNGIFCNDASEKVAALYWGGPNLSPQATAEMNSLSYLDYLLEQTMEFSPSTEASWIVLESLIMRYYPNNPRIHHAFSKLPPPNEYDMREDLDYLIAAPKNNPERKTLWTRVYRDPAMLLKTSVATPIYTTAGDFLGVVGIEIKLQSLIGEILGESKAGSLLNAEREETNQQGMSFDQFSFLVESTGTIIAFPLDRPDSFGISRKGEKIVKLGQPTEFDLFEFSDLKMQELVKRMSNRGSGIEQFLLKDASYMVSFHRVPSTGWILANVVPERNILSSVQQTHEAVKVTVATMIRRFALIALAFLFAAILVTIAFFVRKLSSPLQQLMGTINLVSKGQLGERVHLAQKDEIGELGLAFNEMAASLQEKQVALQKAEEKYRLLVENINVGIYRSSPQGSPFLHANPAMAKIFGYDSVEEFRKLSPEDLYQNPADRTSFFEELQARGFVENRELPLKKKDGTLIWAVSTCRAYRNEDGDIVWVDGMIEDVSERKQAEEARRELSRQRFETCNVMAHELRNALIKIGFVFPAINSVMSFLREQWELEIQRAFPDLEDRDTILMRLGELILMGQPHLGGQKELVRLSEELLAEQVLVANLFLLPQHGKNWLDQRIYPKWQRLLTESRIWDKSYDEVHQLLQRLQKAILIVEDEHLAQKMDHLPEDLRVKWPKLAYTEFSARNLFLLQDVLRLLEHPALNIRHKEQLRKLLTSLKALADITSEIEDRMNLMLLSLKSGDQY